MATTTFESLNPSTGELIEQSDLILTAEAKHRASVVAQCPAALHRTFTLVQFARLTHLAGPVHVNDDTGATLLVASVTSVLLYLSWAGSTYGWFAAGSLLAHGLPAGPGRRAPRARASPPGRSVGRPVRG